VTIIPRFDSFSRSFADPPSRTLNQDSALKGIHFERSRVALILIAHKKNWYFGIPGKGSDNPLSVRLIMLSGRDNAALLRLCALIYTRTRAKEQRRTSGVFAFAETPILPAACGIRTRKSQRALESSAK